MRTVLLTCVFALFAPSSPRAQGVGVELSPTTVTVASGAEFDIDFRVVAAADSFNAYDLILGFDPSKLTIVGRPPSAQEGPLFTGACPNRFHLFNVAPDSSTVSVAHVLLCAGKRVAGPGVLYQLRFRAANLDAVTHLRLLAGTAFYDGGPLVEPLLKTDATVLIGNATPTPPRSPQALVLEAAPNPFNPRTTFRFEVERPGQVQLDIYSTRGLRVATLVDGWRGEGEARVAWNGLDSAGRPVASACYFAKLRIGGQITWRTVALIR